MNKCLYSFSVNVCLDVLGQLNNLRWFTLSSILSLWKNFLWYSSSKFLNPINFKMRSNVSYAKINKYIYVTIYTCIIALIAYVPLTLSVIAHVTSVLNK